MILKKKPNDILVSKLRAILLLEVDFNAINKIVFNIRLISILEAQDTIPRELIRGRCEQSTIYIVINKKLLGDITN